MKTEAEVAQQTIISAAREERVFAAGCALYGIARGLNVPDETRTAIIAVADWLKMSGWSSCQPAQQIAEQYERRHINEPISPEIQPTGALNPAPKVYAKRLVISPFFTKGKDYEVIAEFDNGDFVVNDNRGKRYQVPWSDYHDVWQRVEYVARGELTGRSYTPYNKGDEPPDENTYYNDVPYNVIHDLVDHALDRWDPEEIRDSLLARMVETFDNEKTEEEVAAFAENYDLILRQDIRDNWVLIPEEN